ncbi:DUF6252 family protein [Winogradskyella sp.]|jgi:hypothetical protein|uniref:DUF6252 family protein n=1 Tax=Winogradskyella sp. TaxID=1883156 RepID=UPI0025F88249|nr:DUF6252 family protein [Winogradskyella sp.]MCT4629750.1 DUF6252 family protein [Winogradskyella sp.]
MKFLKIIPALFLALAFVSCDNEPVDSELANSNNPNPSGPSNFQVDFNNETYVATTVVATITDEVINISAIRGAQEELFIITLFGISEGTYDLGIGNLQTNSATYSSQNGGSNPYISLDLNATDTSQGQVIISEIDSESQTISGTFHFTGTGISGDVIEFTNGSFTNVAYQDGLETPNESTFFANVNGNEFVEDAVFGTELSLNGMTTISVSATKNNGETIGLSFDADIAPGNYTFDSFGSLSNVGQYIGDSATDVYLANGSFVIESHDTTNKVIVGTFEFTAEPSPGSTATSNVNITEGSFSVTYY